MSSCTVPPDEMQRRENKWTGYGSNTPNELTNANCDYVEDAFNLNPTNKSDWFTVRIEPGTSLSAITPPMLLGQEMGVATYTYEVVRYYMAIVTKLIFLTLNIGGMQNILMIAATLFVILWGLGIALGYSGEGSGYGVFKAVFRMTLVMAFATNWDLFYSMAYGVVETVVDSLSELFSTAFSPTKRWDDACFIDPTRTLAGAPVIGTVMDTIASGVNAAFNFLLNFLGLSSDLTYGHSSMDRPSPLCSVDYTFSLIWNFKLVKVFLACLVAGFSGWIYMLILGFAMFMYVSVMFNMMFIFIISFVARSFLYAIAPIFFTFALFRQTRSLFDGWLQQVINFMLQPILLFVFIGFFHAMINQYMRVVMEQSDTLIQNATSLSGIVAVATGTKAKATVCYEKLSSNFGDKYGLYWWQFSFNTGGERAVTEGTEADLPFNFFAILVIAGIIFIMKQMQTWVISAAGSISQGFISAASIAPFWKEQGTDRHKDPDSLFEK
ncbi:MAG: type IV secretion system protein [Hyphomicrobiales bacterium]|nr:type IV secretion system protein [Hyphomicrobiales bacterium]